MQAQFKILVSGTAPSSFPTETFFGILDCDDNTTLEIPPMYPFRGEWGKPTSTYLSVQDLFPMPQKIDMVWLSINEHCFYSIEQELSPQKFADIWNDHNKKHETNQFEYIVIGMAPCGKTAIWFYGLNKSVVVEWLKGEKIEVSMKDFLPENPSITLDEYCESYPTSLISNSLHKPSFDKYMQQFFYRYLPLFEKWDENRREWQKADRDSNISEFVFIEESLFDGTHDKLHDDGLITYHKAGKPNRIAVSWNIKKSEYIAYFWFEDEEIQAVFDRFYGAHPETKSDFMIRIDSEKNKYELALYRYGLKEPQVISEFAYQLLVFKNKFEYYRSENYNQPKGAWVW